MANVDNPGLLYQRPAHFHEHGDCNVAVFEFPDITAAVSDVIRFGRLPGGILLLDGVCYAEAGANAQTLRMGFAYANGVTPDGGVAPDDDWFFAATSIASAAIIRKTNPVLPVKIDAEIIVQAVLAGNALAAKDVTMAVYYKTLGTG